MPNNPLMPRTTRSRIPKMEPNSPPKNPTILSPKLISFCAFCNDSARDSVSKASKMPSMTMIKLPISGIAFTNLPRPAANDLIPGSFAISSKNATILVIPALNASLTCAQPGILKFLMKSNSTSKKFLSFVMNVFKNEPLKRFLIPSTTSSKNFPNFSRKTNASAAIFPLAALITSSIQEPIPLTNLLRRSSSLNVLNKFLVQPAKSLKKSARLSLRAMRPAMIPARIGSSASPKPRSIPSKPPAPPSPPFPPGAPNIFLSASSMPFKVFSIPVKIFLSSLAFSSSNCLSRFLSSRSFFISLPRFSKPFSMP